MSENKNSPIYLRNTLEFVTVALEYCTLVEQSNTLELPDFVDKATKMLPLLYLKASLLPQTTPDTEALLEQSVTEDMYESVQNRLVALLGEQDSYLETFHPDMQYSDAPIAAFISENLADIYQDLGNFIDLFRQGNEEVMLECLAQCTENFKNYWGGLLLNALRALHAVRYTDAESLFTNEDEI